MRAVQLFPTKLIGVVADHGDFPIERIAIDCAGEGRWVGSVGHDEILRLTDLKAVFEDEVAGAEEGEKGADGGTGEDGGEDADTSSDAEEEEEDAEARKRMIAPSVKTARHAFESMS